VLSIRVTLAPLILHQHRRSLTDAVDDAGVYLAFEPETHLHAGLDAELHDGSFPGRDELVCVLRVAEEATGDGMEASLGAA